MKPTAADTAKPSRKRQPAIAPMPTRVTITAPDAVLCALPASQRTCTVGRDRCAASMVAVVPSGVEHTRCRIDEGGLVPDRRHGEIARRRADCMRLYTCEDTWIVAHVGLNVNAAGRCPVECGGFIRVGGFVPVEALLRGKVVGKMGQTKQ